MHPHLCKKLISCKFNYSMHCSFKKWVKKEYLEELFLIPWPKERSKSISIP